MLKNSRAKGFTLIELLVVVAIIAILAAILFPVFARARENARRASCMSNMKQIGLGIMMYSQDFDEHLPSGFITFPTDSYTFPNGTTGTFAAWYDVLYPYVKSMQVFNCPSWTDAAYTGNYRIRFFPYSYNYMAPALSCSTTYNCGVSLGYPNGGSASLAAVEDTAGTILVTEGSLGLTRFIPSRMPSEADLHSSGQCLTTQNGTVGNWYAPECLRARHLETMSTLFVDGHVKSMPWKTILGSTTDPNVLRYWTTASDPLQ